MSDTDLSTGPPSRGDEPDPEAEDWLAEEGELDWADTAEHGAVGQAPGGPPPSGERAFRDELVRRRRLVALVALAVAILVIVIVAIVVAGGGGGNKAQPPPTVSTAPPPPPPPAQTTPATPAIKVTVPAGGTLKSGDTGAQVKNLQKALNQLGLDAGKADGDFGASTEAAVMQFQKQHNLAQDGVVGAKTAAAINSALAAQG